MSKIISGSVSGMVIRFPGQDIEIVGGFESSVGEVVLTGTFVIEATDDDFESRPVPNDSVEMPSVEIDPEPNRYGVCRGKVSPNATAPSAWVRKSKA